MNGYHAAKTASALLDRSDRVRLEVSGLDRAKFLHNLTTNDVKRLAVGSGVEAFVTSPQGKTLAHVTILAEEDRLLLRADAPLFENTLAHLRKYGLFDDVSIEDITKSTFELHLAGSTALALAESQWGLLPPLGELKHVSTNSSLRLIRETILSEPGVTVIGPVGEAAKIMTDLTARGAVPIDTPSAEALRIEAGTPLFGRDITPENLPQEVGRDSVAISFVKGCYLGQETVARIDALGHVNKIWRGLRLKDGAQGVPPDGAPLEVDGQTVGRVTSAAYSPGVNAPVARAYVRTTLAAEGTVVWVKVGDRLLEAAVTP
jgi:tRNA-modifying protein YgfZ